MEIKRPRGVIIFTLLGIFFLVMGSTRWLPFKPLQLSIFIIWLILYYFLFQLKNWSRIVLLILNIFLGGAVILLVVGFIVLYIFKPDMLLMDRITNQPISYWLGFALQMIYVYTFIYYFTRPAVKAQFK
ncbi:MAG: hypothetical protein M0R48_07725 [Candidatus Omnitrophica bacterium]|nr:hypothetical protein [Candidatus Omnitrophota bacterium]